MAYVQLITWLHIQPKSPLLHPQLVLSLHHHHHRLLLHRMSVETSPIVQLMRHVVAFLSYLITAWHMVAVNTRMLFAVLEQITAVLVITPFVTLKTDSAFR